MKSADELRAEALLEHHDHIEAADRTSTSNVAERGPRRERGCGRRGIGEQPAESRKRLGRVAFRVQRVVARALTLEGLPEGVVAVGRDLIERPIIRDVCEAGPGETRA